MTIAAKNVGVIENAGPNNVKAFLGDTLNAASKVDIGVAFVTVAGVEHVLRWLKKAGSRGPVRVLTGFYQCFTEPAALRRLLALKSELKGGRFDLRVSRNTHFHWKAYFLFTRSTAIITIGSSNLTNDGLKSSGEMNLTLTLPRATEPAASMHNVFETEWERAKPLTAAVISQYEKARPKDAGRPVRPLIPLSKILGSARISPPLEQEARERVFWRDAIEFYADDETQQAIEEETDWDQKGYSWFSTGADVLRRRDRIVIFDMTSDYVELVEVVQTTRMTLSTPCGRYFAAYRRVRGSHRRRINRALWVKLRQFGAVKNKEAATSRRKLTQARFDDLVDLLRLTR